MVAATDKEPSSEFGDLRCDLTFVVLLCEEAQPVSPLDAIMPESTPDRMTNCFVFMSFSFF
jgi:hypothetical protein